jgi:hypothetical protein
VKWTVTYRPGEEPAPREYPPAKCLDCEGLGLRKSSKPLIWVYDEEPGMTVEEWQRRVACPRCNRTGNEPTSPNGTA